VSGRTRSLRRRRRKSRHHGARDATFCCRHAGPFEFHSERWEAPISGASIRPSGRSERRVRCSGLACHRSVPRVPRPIRPISMSSIASGPRRLASSTSMCGRASSTARVSSPHRVPTSKVRFAIAPADGVYFTKPGARKLAHYVEREIQPHRQQVGRPWRCDCSRACNGGQVCGPAVRRSAAGRSSRSADGLGDRPSELLGSGQRVRDRLGSSRTRVLTKGEAIPAASGRRTTSAGRAAARGIRPVSAETTPTPAVLATPDSRRRDRTPQVRHKSG